MHFLSKHNHRKTWLKQFKVFYKMVLNFARMRLDCDMPKERCCGIQDCRSRSVSGRATAQGKGTPITRITSCLLHCQILVLNSSTRIHLTFRMTYCAATRPIGAFLSVVGGILSGTKEIMAFTADMHHDCHLMLERFDRECNTTRYTADFARACTHFETTREYRRIYYRVQTAAEGCFIQ